MLATWLSEVAFVHAALPISGVTVGVTVGAELFVSGSSCAHSATNACVVSPVSQSRVCPPGAACVKALA